jgi:hypothetical protein
MAGSAWTNQVQNQVIIGGPNGRILIYNGNPAAGNLLYSNTGLTAPGIDPFGNALLPGSVEYDPVTGTALQIYGNEITEYFAPSQAGPYASTGSQIVFGIESPGAIQVNGAFGAVGGTVSNPSLLTTDTWHDLRPLNTGFTGSVAGFWPPQYWLNAFGAVELFGTVGLPSTGFNGVTWGTIAPDWRPAVPSFIHADMISNAGSAPGNSQGQYVEVGTDGSLQFHGLPSGAGAGPVSFQGWWPLSSGPITS